jgi:hypothetical protein
LDLAAVHRVNKPHELLERVSVLKKLVVEHEHVLEELLGLIYRQVAFFAVVVLREVLFQVLESLVRLID